jgi:hypothetical protein
MGSDPFEQKPSQGNKERDVIRFVGFCIPIGLNGRNCARRTQPGHPSRAHDLIGPNQFTQAVKISATDGADEHKWMAVDPACEHDRLPSSHPVSIPIYPWQESVPLWFNCVF